MGQQISVTVRAGASPSVRIFELNRSLTGMAIERYAAGDEIRRARPPDVLARRVLALGAESITVSSSMVTVAAPADQWGALEPKVVDAIEHLFGYYGESAGWSPDALRAVGVEPMPAPEPAG
jgi:hypothetical protein